MIFLYVLNIVASAAALASASFSAFDLRPRFLRGGMKEERTSSEVRFMLDIDPGWHYNKHYFHNSNELHSVCVVYIPTA